MNNKFKRVFANKLYTLALLAFLTLILLGYFGREHIGLVEPKFIRSSCAFENFKRSNCTSEKEDVYSFKVDVERQKVLEVIETPNMPKLTRELDNCKVFDKSNWSCDIWRMSDKSMEPAIRKGLEAMPLLNGKWTERTPDTVYDFERR